MNITAINIIIFSVNKKPKKNFVTIFFKKIFESKINLEFKNIEQFIVYQF
jgi:hypothetical protein